MEKTIKTTKNRWLTSMAMAYLAIMLAWMSYCAIASHRVKGLQRTVTTTSANWTSDTTWAGGW
jgi:hypothetical protein